MSFDADAYLDSLQPPEIKLGGKTYKGRLLSLEEWMPFEPRLQAVASEKATVEEIRGVIKDFCDAVFPVPLLDLLNFRRKTVGEQVVALPPAALLKAAAYFFECQARAMRGKNQETNNKEE